LSEASGALPGGGSTSAKPKVLYISSVGRSGTTLMSLVLGQLPGFCDVGELWALWRPAFATGTCGCGLFVRDCPFWLAVAKSALGQDYEHDGPELGRLHKRRLGTTRAANVWLHVRGLHRLDDYDHYARGLEAHYRAIADQSGARVIVDCSDMPADGILASSLDSVELFVLHMVRDPRGVAYSWGKDINLTGNEGARGDVHGPGNAALRWSLNNLYTNRLLAPLVPGRSRVLRYEDFVTDPRGVLSDLLAWLGEEPTELPLVADGRAVVLESTHSVFGNRLRFHRGTVPLRLDLEWQERMPARDRHVVTAVAAPYLRRYRYPWRTSGPSVEPDGA